jgi:hypothetical protein
MRHYNGINVMEPGTYAKWIDVKPDEEVTAITQDVVSRDLESDVTCIGKQLSSESYRGACHDHALKEQQWMLDKQARRISYLEKEVKSQARGNFMHLILTGVLTWVVIEHDKILGEHRRRLDRLEEVMRLRREQGKES